MAREVSDPRHMYGNESGGPGALDPTINTYDLGADPLAWGAERSALIRDVLPDLPEYVLQDNTPYADLVSAYRHLMGEYARAVAPAVKYIGGQYMNRDRVGDDRPPFVNVPKDEQEEALQLLVDRVFAPEALVLDTDVLTQFGAEGRSGWGFTRTFNGRFDFPYHQEVLAFQSSVMNQLLNPARLSRIRDGETKFGPGQVVTIPELMTSLTEAVWSDLESGAISATRRDLQRAYLDSMTDLIVSPAQRTPADARSVARWQLNALRGRLAAAPSGDAYTQAHIAEALARIDKALEAGLEAEN